MTRLNSKSKTELLENFKGWIFEQIGSHDEISIDLTSFKSKYFPVQNDIQIEIILISGTINGSEEVFRKFLNFKDDNKSLFQLRQDESASLGQINFFWPLGVIKTEDIPKVEFDTVSSQIFTSENGVYSVLDCYESDLLIRKLFESINLTFQLDEELATKDFVTIRRVTDSADRCQIYVIDSKFRICFYKYCIDSPNAGVDVLEKLEVSGFNHLAAPLARYMVGRNLVGLVIENFEAAITLEAMVNVSLRDLFDYRGDPTNAGADLSEEFRRLGEMLAKLHILLEQKYHSTPETSENLTEVCGLMIKRDASKEAKSVKEDLKTIGSFEDFGLAIRIYNSLYLDIIYRTDMGWCLVDFGQDNFEIRVTPLVNIAQLLAQVKRVIDEQVSMQLESDTQKITILSNAWLKLNSEALIDGYMEQIEVHGIVPRDREVVNKIVTTAYRCLLAAAN